MRRLQNSILKILLCTSFFNCPHLIYAEKTGEERNRDEGVDWQQLDPTKSLKITFPEGQVQVPAWNGKGEKGAVFSVKINGRPSEVYGIYFRRFDPEGAVFDEFLGESQGNRHPVPVKFILQKRNADGQVEDELSLGQWTHVTAEAVDLDRAKIVQFIPYMNKKIIEFSGGKLTGALVRQEIDAHLHSRDSVRLMFIPRYFEFARLPKVLKLYPAVEATIANTTNGDTKMAQEIRRKILSEQGPAPKSPTIPLVFAIQKRCARLISNLLSHF